MSVYVVEAIGLDRVKIGYCGTTDPTARLSAMQVGSAVPLVLRRLFTYLGRRGERDAHLRFQPHRIQGEWFHFAPDIRAWTESPEREYETSCQREADRRARVHALAQVSVEELRERLAAAIRAGGGPECGELFEALKPRVSLGERRAWYGNRKHLRDLYPEDVRRVELMIAL